MKSWQVIGLLMIGAYWWRKKNEAVARKPCNCLENQYQFWGGEWIGNMYDRLAGRDLKPLYSNGQTLDAIPGQIGVANLGMLPNWRGDLA